LIRRWAVFYTWGRRSTVQYCLKHNLASNGYTLVDETTPGHCGIDAEREESCPTRPTAIGTVKLRMPLAVSRDLLAQQGRAHWHIDFSPTLCLTIPFTTSS
jgi:hypothetical protein